MAMSDSLREESVMTNDSMFGAFSKAFLAEAADFHFLGCSFDEILLSWNMFSDFSEPTKAGVCMRIHLFIFTTIRGSG
jgi:hypothetical protein